MKYLHMYALLLTAVVNTVNGQDQSAIKTDSNPETIVVSGSGGPQKTTRSIIQDKSGNIWIAAFDGIFKYDGRAFTHITDKVSSARFYAVLEDRKGFFWFASANSGVYYYDGKSLKNYTTKNGLATDRVAAIYEDKTGGIWFGTEMGASRYDGKTFQNFKISDAAALPGGGDSVHVSGYQPDNDVNTISEDKNGKLWFGTKGNTSIYDGKAFTVVTNTDGKSFKNVGSIIKDQKGNIWLGGNDGLWRYDGSKFTNFKQKAVGSVIQDKQGNILTASVSAHSRNWAISRYDQLSFTNNKPAVTEILSTKGTLYGVFEAKDGSIWFGSANGVHRYDGKTVTDFKE
jgi:ligand-binding sensor domain-containing protein